MGLDALLKNKLGYGPNFQKLHIHSLSSPGCQNWAYFHSMGSGFWDNGWFSKLPYLAMKLGHWPKFQKWHIYSLIQGLEIGLILALRAAVSEILADFQNFHMGMIEFQKLHIYSLSTPRGRKRVYVQLLEFGQLPSFMPKYGNFEKWSVSRKSLPVEQYWAQFEPLGVEKGYMCNLWNFGHLSSFMPKYGNFENWCVSWNPLPVEQK